MVVFKMRDSVPSVRYSRICNVLRLWRTLLIGRLYDIEEDVHYTHIEEDVHYILKKMYTIY